MFALKKLAKAISQPTVEGISLIPLGTTDNGSVYSPSAFIDGRLGITPSKVTGEVVLCYPEEEEVAKVNRVEVILRGQCETVWIKEDAAWNGVKLESNSDVHLFLNKRQVLWQPETPIEYTKMANKCFPFSIELPEDVPSTMRTENVEVKYTLEVLVSIVGKHGPGLRTFYKILPVLNYGSSLAMITSVPGYIGDPAQLSLPPEYVKQGLSWKCTLDSGSIVYRHEPTRAHVALTIPAGSKRIKVSNVFLALKEHIVFNDDKGIQLFTFSRYVAKTRHDQVSVNGAVAEMTIHAQPPRTNTAYTGSISRLVSIRHSLELRVSLSGTKDISVSVPVIITPLARADIGRLKKESEARAETVTTSITTTTTTTTTAATATTTMYPDDNDDAPPAYESGDWIPSPPETDTSSAPPAYS
ncbi:hypothetical protein GQ42DRAFT_163736, partial [Ramicandelaber brevisporus]